jgi:hypothetical protein
MNTRVNNHKSDAASADLSATSLEQRIVACLSDNTAEARTIAALVTETEQAVIDAQVIADRMQEIALDPAQSPDLAKAAEAATFAGLVVSVSTICCRASSKPITASLPTNVPPDGGALPIKLRRAETC